ncbi:MAG: T9SS type A sorting domain-containing protein [Gemmatimonadota bacterium]|nr:MAG: T9SS type A sorting domain-containing protein [Gemmatimonadota bacterium]
MKATIAFFGIVLILISNTSALACTGITASRGNTILFGNNEDWNDHDTYIWFTQPAEGKFGGVYFGYSNFWQQGGMNEKGLCFDGFATPYYAVHNPDNKPQYQGRFLEKVMEECQNIEEVVDLFGQYYLPWLSNCQLFFIDRTGASVIIEGDSLVYKEGAYQVCTNFYQTNPQVGWWPCWRYNTAVEMFENSDSISVDLFRSILDACHQSGSYPTLYSNIYDLNEGVVYVYLDHDFNNVWKIDLAKELALGAHTHYLPSLSGLDFAAEPTSGHAPLTTQFRDISTAFQPITSWAWDFDNDGIIDSEDQNPAWTYPDTGSYTVSLEFSNGTFFYSRIYEDCIRVFDGESALEFDGAESYVSCPSVPSLNLTQTLTVEAWIKPANWGENSILGFGRVVDKRQFALFLVGSHPAYNDYSLGLQLYHENGPISFSTTPEHTVTLDEWQHVAVTYDGTTNEVNMYINGIEQTLTQPQLPSGPITDNSGNDLIIGSDVYRGYTFDGTIDEVRLWNVIRSEEEIAESMDSYLLGIEAGLVGCWQMNEGYGETTADLSDFSHTGLLNDATWIQGIHLSPAVLDADDDGILDADDNCPNDPNPGQEDKDFDAVGDVCDNCPDDPNADQADRDSDGTGDMCDSCMDTDGDGYGNPGYPINTCEEDNCPDMYNPDQEPIERGNIDCLGDIDVMDVLSVVNHILGTASLIGDPLDRADCNGDGRTDILDAVGIIKVILGTGECAPDGSKPLVTSDVVRFCESLKSYLSLENYVRFMDLVKAEVYVPAEYSLFQNHPNPFNPETEIAFALPKSSEVTIKVYNVIGQEVDVLVDSELDAGFHRVKWNASYMTSGVYFYRLKAGTFTAVEKMIVLK